MEGGERGEVSGALVALSTLGFEVPAILGGRLPDSQNP